MNTSPSPTKTATITDEKSPYAGQKGRIVACALSSRRPVCSVRFPTEELAVWFHYDQVEAKAA